MKDLTSKLAIGLAAMGGFTQRARVDGRQVADLLSTAYDLGIRSADGATLYKSWKIVGEALAALDVQDRAPRDAFKIFGKCGRSLVPTLPGEGTTQPKGAWTLNPPWNGLTDIWDFSPAGIRLQLANTLEHLGLGCIEGLALHDPADCRKLRPDGFLFERDAVPALDMLRQLRGAGWINQIGIGSKEIPVTVELLEGAESGTFDYIGPTVVNLFNHSEAIADLIPLCHARDIDVILAGPLAGGILCGEDPLTANVLCNYELPTELERQKGRLIFDICERHGVSIRDAALRFAANLLELPHPSTAKPVLNRIVLGARNAAELTANVESLSAEIPDDLWAELASTQFDGTPLIHPLCPFPGR